MSALVLATGNKGKVSELQSLLRGLSVSVQAQTELGVSEVAETGLTFVENALIKARHACSQTGLPAIADDSGLVVPALKGAPGLYSARYAGPQATDADNLALLLDNMRYLEGSQRQAHFHCTLVYLRHAQDPAPLIAVGTWQGSVLLQPQGQLGFGYDPVFLVPELGVSAAELEPNVKNLLSHRGQALKQLLALLQKEVA